MEGMRLLLAIPFKLALGSAVGHGWDIVRITGLDPVVDKFHGFSCQKVG